VIAVAVSQPKFSNISVSETNVILSGTNGTAGANYAVLTATNVTTASSNGSASSPTSSARAEVCFTNPIAPGRTNLFRIAHREIENRKANHENNISENPRREFLQRQRSQH